MKVRNPQDDRPFLANVFGRWYEIPAGESIDVEDPAHAAALVEHGAKAENGTELEHARRAWADRNRGANSQTASASASEGKIAARRQATVNVAQGGVDGDVVSSLRGKALDEAVKVAREQGAEIDSRASADEKRQALAAFAAGTGGDEDDENGPDETDGFVVDDDGDVILDGEGQPYALDEVERDEDGEVVFDEDGKPIRVEA